MAVDLEREKKTIDVSDEIASFEGEEVDEVFLHARDLMNIFVKTIKAFRIFPPENPSLVGFRELLFRKFQFFLKRYHVFSFKIGEYEFSFNNRVMYENKDLKGSLAFFLYKDGLREFRFLEGLEEWEIQGFLDIIKRGDQVNKQEDDLVTMIWERDFVHISYQATDEYLEDTAVIIPENIEQFRKNLIFEPLAHQIDPDYLDEETGEEVNYYEAMTRAASPPSLAMNRDVYFLTPQELEGLRKEVETETSPIFLFNIIDILFEIMGLEKKPEPYQDAVTVLNKLLDALLTLGEFQKATDLLSRVFIILKTYSLQEWQLKAIQDLAESAGDPQRIERIGKVLERREGVRLDEVRGYLKLLKPSSLQPLMKVLGDLGNPKARRTVCDAVCEIGKDQIDQILPFMEDRRWYLVRNVVYILGRIGKEPAIPSVQKALGHREMRVRREAVQALGAIGGAKAFHLLIKALQDVDVRIRCAAALNLGKVGRKNSLPYLLEVIQAKEFTRKEAAEKKAFFDAIGLAGSNDPIPLLRKLLMKKAWFRRKRMDELRQGAASALALIASREAKEVLERGQESRNARIRQACQQALRRQVPKEQRF
ncbi:MAG: HEAT repeat domain-containing protein [Deltaproteobacteria bacterium]|nr:HEAT repeat domain-containing protein [Deltaproteobacteria bacterium]